VNVFVTLDVLRFGGFDSENVFPESPLRKKKGSFVSRGRTGEKQSNYTTATTMYVGCNHRYVRRVKRVAVLFRRAKKNKKAIFFRLFLIYFIFEFSFMEQ
jgi:hypothetical protein